MIEKTIRNCVKAVFVNGDGKMLILRNAEPGHETEQQFWDFPGGGVEEGEKDLEALIREIKEETSRTLYLIEGESKFSTECQHYVDDSITMRFKFFGGFMANPRIFVSKEHDEFKWISPDDCGKYEFMQALQEVVPELVNMAKGLVNTYVRLA